MADIVRELNTILRVSYGKDNRMPIHDSLKKINDDFEEKKHQTPEGGEGSGGYIIGTRNNT